jgi:RNA polymerase sigma-70 factor (ECF subfamily)
MGAGMVSASSRARSADEPLDVAIDSAEALMEAFLDGDALAFERLFRQLSPRVRAVLYSLCGDLQLAEDLTQTVFLKLYRARSGYQRGMLVAPWVFAIARNAFFDHRRRLRRRPEALSSDGVLPEQFDQGSPDDSAERALLQLLQVLPAPQREALVLLKLRGLTLAEAAGLCGTSPASIKMRAQRAYQRLRQIMFEGTQS